MPILHISVFDKIAYYQKRDGDIVCGNTDYTMEFTFDSEWDSYIDKTARFIWNGEYVDVDIVDTEEEDGIKHSCVVPKIKNTDTLEVGVYSGDLSTTTKAVISCKRSVLCGSVTPMSDEEVDAEYASIAQECATRASASAAQAAASARQAQAAASSLVIPSTLPNPHALTINGTAYDGSRAVNLTIQGGGGGIDQNTEERITDLETSVGELVEAYERFDSDVEDIARPIAVDEAGKVNPRVTTLESKTTTLEGKVSTLESKLGSITLSINNDDGKLYIYINGSPVGGGITLPEGASCDIEGNFDSDGNLILTGDIPDGTYVGYITESGNIIRIGDVDLYCTVTNSLTYCTNSNTATSVANGSSYSATITANSGYTLKTVTATMGGNAVSVSNGKIDIANVTGDIVITAVAEKAVVQITNYIETVGYTADTRLSLSSGSTTSASGYECSGFIPAKRGDVIRIKNIDITSENATNIIGYDSNKNPYRGGVTSGNYGCPLYGLFVTNGTNSNGVYTATLDPNIANAFGDDLAYIRIGSKSITSDSILTINQEIV